MLEKILDCQTEIVNTIKLLIYKEDSSILEKINFDDDDIFLEPLLFTYFNYKNVGQFSSDNLTELMEGYYIEKTNNYKVLSFSNEQGIAYIPNIGYFDKNNTSFFESISLINETKIEILKFKLSLLDYIFNNSNEGKSYLNEIILDNFVYEKNIGFLTKALHLIKQNSLGHYKLIEKCCRKILLFKTNPENTNSFATINAHGIAFLNVYQDDYNVVFFIDDIAHQTGHIILTTLLYNRKNTFKIDEDQNVGKILGNDDYRSFYILIHALYTYYATFLCLDACLENNSFNPIEKKEAIGRIGFYLNKCSLDLNNFENFTKHYGGVENILTKNGIEIYNLIREKYTLIRDKWLHTILKLDYNNQTYNFTFEVFNKNNK